jgi:glyoxylase-like metal-dependent hydrolase (beta-lactamase superfamily II)
VRLTSEVYVVGGGANLCFGLSDDPDCHVYLLDGGDEYALIDCGMAAGRSLDRIAENILREGLDLTRLRTLILTHYHMDHAGGAAAVRERFGLQVWAPRGAVAALRTGDEAAVALDVAKAAGFYAADYRFTPVAVDRELDEGDRLRVGDLELEVIDTPGHCDGHVSYLMRGRERRALFAGDAVFSGGRVVWQNIHDCSVPATIASIQKLRGVEFDSLLPGHAAVVLDGGRRHVELAAAQADRLGVPGNLTG